MMYDHVDESFFPPAQSSGGPADADADAMAQQDIDRLFADTPMPEYQDDFDGIKEETHRLGYIDDYFPKEHARDSSSVLEIPTLKRTRPPLPNSSTNRIPAFRKISSGSVPTTQRPSRQLESVRANKDNLKEERKGIVDTSLWSRGDIKEKQEKQDSSSVNSDSNTLPETTRYDTVSTSPVSMGSNPEEGSTHENKSIWVQRFSNKHKCNYWFNTMDGSSQWTPPQDWKVTE